MLVTFHRRAGPSSAARNRAISTHIFWRSRASSLTLLRFGFMLVRHGIFGAGVGQAGFASEGPSFADLQHQARLTCDHPDHAFPDENRVTDFELRFVGAPYDSIGVEVPSFAPSGSISLVKPRSRIVRIGAVTIRSGYQRLLPKPPPLARSPFGRASLTFRQRPSRSVPLTAVIAFSPSPSFAISTKPKPRGWPVSRSVTMLTLSTVPWVSNNARTDSSEAPKLRFPT